jgi:hypothetical protein
MKTAISIIYFIAALFFALFASRCQSRELSVSSLEKFEGKNETLAAFVFCQRTMLTDKPVAGANVSFCSELKERYLVQDENEKCLSAMGGLVVEGKNYLPTQLQEIANIKALCYLMTFKRTNELKATLFDNKK